MSSRTWSGLPVLALGLLPLTVSADETSQREWANEVAGSKAQAARLLSPGREPRRLLAPPLGPGQELACDLQLDSSTQVSGAAPTLTRSTTLSGQLHLRHTPAGDDSFSVELELRGLTGNLRHLELLPKTGSLQPGAYGEPWAFVLDTSGADAMGLKGEERLLWQHDVAEWTRRLLLPIPPEPVGVGARWERSWTDYFSYESTAEHCRYELVALGPKLARIQVQITASAGTAAGFSKGESAGVLDLPLGARAVPNAVWTERSTADLVLGTRAHAITTTTLKMRPFVAKPKP